MKGVWGGASLARVELLYPVLSLMRSTIKLFCESRAEHGSHKTTGVYPGAKRYMTTCTWYNNV
jgi:hypothetical protein